MSRLKAFSIHLGISLLIFTALLYLIVFHWYPSPFFSTDGGWQGLRLLAMVDIVLGPVLTLVIFNPEKPVKKRRMDLSIIGVIQIVALLSGSWVVYKEHPVAKIIVDGIIKPVTAYDLSRNNLKLKDLENFGTGNTMFIYSNLPDDFREMQKLRIKSYRENHPLYLHTDLYTKIDNDIIKKISLFSINMDYYLVGKKKEKNIYEDFLASQGRPASDFIFLSLHTRYARTIAVLDKNTVEFVDVLTKILAPPVEIRDNLIQFKRVYVPTEEERNKSD